MTLLPLNAWRLRQLLLLAHQIAEANSAKLSMDWLKAYSRRREVRAGERLFCQGDPATEVLFVLSGRLRALEADVVLGAGDLFGELGLLSSGKTRTQTVVCEQDASLLVVTYDEIRHMYYQNPKFGFYFLELAAQRLMRDAARRL